MLQCVLMGSKCDGVSDCENGMDESVETCGCLQSEFQCNHTTCIDKILRCDRNDDCSNGLDERECDIYICPLGTHVKCDNHFCVPRDKQCDFLDDCGDNSDEKICERRECVATEFKCNNSQCVAFGNLCDGLVDCVDGSDEDQVACDSDKYFQCAEGSLIKKEFVCDGWVDCKLTFADELNCESGLIHYDHDFRCSDTRCIQKSNVCDGYCDCKTCDDEEVCANNTYGCPMDTKYMCRSIYGEPRCIDKDNVCNMINDCRDGNVGTDEYYCSNDSECKNFQAAMGFFYCPEERCLAKHLYCDLHPDCINGEDEQSCLAPPKCSQDEFQCHHGKCIPISKRCDSVHDCVDWSDEMNCENHQCAANMKSCLSGHCIEEHKWCNFHRECPDGSDEKDCDPRPVCEANQFRCKNGQCIDPLQVCVKGDKYDGCADQSHLINCSQHICLEGQFRCRKSFCINQTKVCDGTVDCLQGMWDENNCRYWCPHGQAICQCEGVTMDCTGQKLKEMPVQQMEEDLSKLMIGDNLLNLTSTTFSATYYDKVTYLDLSRNHLTEIPIYSFQNMWKLTHLNLADNNITSLKNGSLLGLSNLKQLHINGNKIETIEEDTFSSMIHLTVLDLSNQRLTHVYKNMFKGLKQITVLNISRNQINSIDNGAFNNLANVRLIDLSGNVIKDIGQKVFMGLPRLVELKTDSYRFCCLAPEGVKCSPKQDEFSSCEDLMSNHVLRVSIWVLGVIALVGNFVVIFWRVRDFRGGKVHSFLITNLAIGDFLMGVYLLIIATADTYYRGVYISHDENWKQSGLCQFAGFVSTFSSELSVLTLSTITLDRLICILFPLRRTRLGLRQAIIVMSCIWVLVFLLAVLPLLGFSYFENFYGRSGVCLALHVTPDRRPGWEYSVGVFILLNLLSFVLIASSYLWMFSVAKKTRSAVRTAESKNDNAMARRMTLIVMTDFCCWVPIIVLGFVSLAGARADDQVYAWIAVFVLPLNSATNPVIYTLSTAPFLGNVRKRANRFRKSFIHSFTGDTKHSYVDDGTTHSYCEKKSPYRQLELKRLRSLNSSPPMYYNTELHSDS
ncbi:unnamed protein product [Lymnaea stagnalis]|uniref:G-protein coupled receptors family 1 profile domain-containing protein n=1 Tax=Lymnaea stagnalis TaxID=6523 RepID=A0AAV2HQR5_LYMST